KLEQAPFPAFAGETTTITVVVENRGPQAAGPVTATGRMPGLTLASYVASSAGPPFCISDLDTCVDGGCAAAVGEPFVVHCNLGSLGQGQSVRASFGAFLAVGTWTALADASGSLPDPTPADASTRADIEVISRDEFASSAGVFGCATGRSAGGLLEIGAFLLACAAGSRRAKPR
ncbi:MAG TPA: hypothetical protein VE964_18330, partial [Myxococcales bacterium]|nr:hypothetical protein [Myxococcales bacterium]